ncbi:MAG: YihA family ribosome biogenesis GTP-binding protein [Bacteroidetes bacterium]|nr:MAG: YihA family ribosome biogenesis GTP-binding protein [Bacteroidota bacterium]
MKINYADFIISSTIWSKCPEPDKPEYAMIGRSNVGKSSLINMISGRKKLAKISGTPGKTITINHFQINGEWYLVDLPGYGYARRSKTERAKWEKMIKGYILNRENLMTLFALIDVRHEPQKNDMEFIEWLGMSNIPFVMIFTKADKLTRNQLESNLAAYKKTLLINWEELPPMIVTSSETGMGKEEFLTYIEETNKLFAQIPGK